VNVFAFVLFIIAAVIFFLVSDAALTRYRRSSVALGLGVLTVGFIIQFCAASHEIHF
jgi:uncharacterized membrane protein YGL010W